MAWFLLVPNRNRNRNQGHAMPWARARVAPARLDHHKVKMLSCHLVRFVFILYLVVLRGAFQSK